MIFMLIMCRLGMFGLINTEAWGLEDPDYDASDEQPYMFGLSVADVQPQRMAATERT